MAQLSMTDSETQADTAAGPAGLHYDFRREPTLAVYSDRERCAADEQAGLAGLRITVRAPIAALLTAEYDAADVTWVDLHSASPAGEENALVEALRRCDGPRTIVNASEDTLDLVYAALGAGAAELMVSASAIAQQVALRSAAGQAHPSVSDMSDTESAAELARLKEEVARIAHALSGLSREDTDRLVSHAPPVPLSESRVGQLPHNWPFIERGVSDRDTSYRAEPSTSATSGGVETEIAPAPAHRQLGVTAHDIRKMIRMRRIREQHFKAELFSDPAWDMLLDLMAARLERLRVSVSSLCIASAVPPTTALRWIKTMTDAGLFERRQDPHDGRRVFIAIADEAADRMGDYFDDMLAVSSLLPV